MKQETTNRRDFLRQGGAAALAFAAMRGGAADAPRKPNFVFILTDDQRWDIMGCVQREMGDKARFPWFKTPNLDRIAAEGFRFRNAFVVNSLCAPSRATFMTGCYGHVNGIVNNHTPFPADNVTHATLLGAAGYATAYIGKWHMGSQPERPGFSHHASFIGQGVYFNCPFMVDGTLTPSTGWVDDVSTDYAEQFIRKNKDRPFSVTIGFKATHGPFTPPPRREKDFEGEEARAVPNLDAPAVYRTGAKATRPKHPGESPSVKTNLGYFRCIAAMDDNVGRILKTLDELGLTEDTMVIFAGDNGYYLGEHGLGDKRSAYEESLRIPLLLRYPRLGTGGKTIDAMALNIDLAPTLVDFAGLPAAPRIQGKSWRPLLTGAPAADWRKAWFYCYFYERGFSTPMVTGVRTERAKLLRYPGHDEWTELFDIAADPYELKNLWSDPAAAGLRKELEAEYDRQAAAIAFRVPDYADSPAADAGIQGNAPRKNQWVLEYRFDRDQGGKVTDASGCGNDGETRGALPAVEGREGRKARRFDGQAFIEVPNRPSLDPSGGPWTFEAVVRADQPDGVVLARGGPSNGYILYFEGGRPAAAVAVGGDLTVAASRAKAAGEWVRLTGRITADRKLVLEVEGKPAAERALAKFIAQDPRDSMQIGADLRNAVVEKTKLPNFTGLIESVRIFSGEAPAAK